MRRMITLTALLGAMALPATAVAASPPEGTPADPPDQGERADQGQRPDQGQRADEGQRQDEGKRPDNSSRQERGESGSRGQRPDGSDRGQQGSQGQRPDGEPGQRGRDIAAAKRERVLAVRACRTERGESEASIAAFRARYGTNVNKRNAFGMCVSGHVRSDAPETREEVREIFQEARERRAAVRQCFLERSEDLEGFRETYGTNPNRRNAFGMCVSSKVKQIGDDDSESDNGDEEEENEEENGDEEESSSGDEEENETE